MQGANPCAAQAHEVRLRLFRDSAGSGRLSARMTLCEFFAAYVRPVVLVPAGAARRNIEQYEQSLGYWRRLVGDPPLAAIDEYTCARFVAGLRELPGRHGRLSSNTVRKHCFHVQRVLNLAGPWANTAPLRQAQGLLDRVPYLPAPPAVEEPTDDAFTLEEIEAFLDACSVAIAPRGLHVSPEQWWRALILFLANTGLRIGSVLRLRWDYVVGSELRVPPGAMKGRRRAHWMPLNSGARQALALVEGGGELIFPWPHTESWLHAQRRRILAASRVEEHRRFGFHALRKGLSTRLFRDQPQIAQIVLGHTNISTTRRHYVAKHLVSEALERLAQPKWSKQRQLRLF